MTQSVRIAKRMMRIVSSHVGIDGISIACSVFALTQMVFFLGSYKAQTSVQGLIVGHPLAVSDTPVVKAGVVDFENLIAPMGILADIAIALTVEQMLELALPPSAWWETETCTSLCCAGTGLGISMPIIIFQS